MFTRLASVDGDALYRQVLEVIRVTANRQPPTVTVFVDSVLQTLQTFPGNARLWLAELLTARPTAQETTEEFLMRQVVLRELLKGVYDPKECFFFNNSVFANMLLHQVLTVPALAKDLHLVDFFFGLTTTQKFERVVLSSLDLAGNAAMIKYLDSLAHLALSGQPVEDENFYETSLLFRPQTQLALGEHQSRFRHEVGIVVSKLHENMRLVAEQSATVLLGEEPWVDENLQRPLWAELCDADARAEKIYCSLCGANLTGLSPDHRRVVDELCAAHKGRPRSPYESAIDARRQEEEAQNQERMYGSFRQGDTRSSTRERKPVGGFVPYKGNSRTKGFAEDDGFNGVCTDGEQGGTEGAQTTGLNKREPISRGAQRRIGQGGGSNPPRYGHFVGGMGQETTKKPVCQIDGETGRILGTFESGATASKYTRVHSNSISRCAQGKSATGGGFVWRFVSDLSKDELKTQQVELADDLSSEQGGDVSEASSSESQASDSGPDSIRGMNKAMAKAEDAMQAAMKRVHSKLTGIRYELQGLMNKRQSLLRKYGKSSGDYPVGRGYNPVNPVTAQASKGDKAAGGGMTWDATMQVQQRADAAVVPAAARDEMGNNRKAIQQIHPVTGKVKATFASGVEAAAMCRIPRTTISSCCRGIVALAGGYKWRFVEDVVPGVSGSDVVPGLAKLDSEILAQHVRFV